MIFTILPLYVDPYTGEFTKRVWEISSQLFVCRGIDRSCILCNKQLRRHLTNLFREFPCTFHPTCCGEVFLILLPPLAQFSADGPSMFKEDEKITFFPPNKERKVLLQVGSHWPFTIHASFFGGRHRFFFYGMTFYHN